MPGEDTLEQEVESESPSPLPKLTLQEDALKSSVPESTAVTKKDQRGDGFTQMVIGVVSAQDGNSFPSSILLRK